MQLDALTALFASSQSTRSLRKGLRTRATRLAAYNLSGSSPAMLLAALLSRDSYMAPMLVLGDNPDDAGYIYHDLSRLCGEQSVAFMPSGYKRNIKFGQPDPPQQILRTEALDRWANDRALRFMVSYPEAIAEKVASRDSLSSHTLTLERGATYNMTDIIVWLRENGFREEDYVYEPGHFALRGSILDIFGYSHELPFRLDFFDDELDSIRSFDIETQLSRDRLDRVSISANMANGSDGDTIADYVGEHTLLVARDLPYVMSRVREITAQTFSPSAALAEEGDPDCMHNVVDADRLQRGLDAMRQLRFTAGNVPDSECTVAVDFDCAPQGVFHKNFDLIADSIRRLTDEDHIAVYILTESEGQAQRLHDIFRDRGDNLSFTTVEGTLHEGFVCHPAQIALFTDHQIFDRYHKYTLRSDRARSGKLALSLKELNSIEIDDYIVHVDHGVGRFAGLVRTTIGGRTQEMIKLEYAQNDVLFVSIHALHKLAKYRGKDGVEPRINRLGSGAWHKLKERTKSKLKEIARDLIMLYADRATRRGYAFSPDSFLQHELEASFRYEDTPDQLAASRAVKADMESDRPMDRLVCGDVGFGKTEIAIRAAFKAAGDSKQTAVLVPTTVLAYQHYNTFCSRLKDLPVRVDYLSRARTPKETRAILADLADGKIDILIGTHKLIGKDVKFKDLGLLIVDEEQKFGVAVKEKLKQLKTNVDTLTMTATPIPRTLQFSLMGARDLSAINTPPPNRRPIQTVVDILDDRTIADAIGFEVARGGQVFVINPRIEGLYDLEAMIRRLVPDARTIVAHGQMPPDKLEKTIMEFTAHEYDVLLATTIVESGIDMPNVNTIIVNNAHFFGLSELHQLRGRVGRSDRKAFCHLLTPPGMPLTPVARRRLQAIESFSDLGSGINIAMQDLDIRGAGNLLGAEQSGFIADLGFETYQRILREAMAELHAEQPISDDRSATPGAVSLNDPDDASAFVADTLIDSDMELLLPAYYVPQENERIMLYRELDSITRELDLNAFRERLVDRFGKIPHVAAELLRVPTLRMLARKLGIERVVLRREAMSLYFPDSPDHKSDNPYYQSRAFGRILTYLSANTRRCRFHEKENGRRSISISDVTTVETAVDILNTILTLSPLPTS